MDTGSMKENMLALKSINIELRRLDGNKKNLKAQAAIIEKSIIEYLKEKDGIKGVKTKDSSGSDTCYMLQTSQKTLNKTLNDKKKTSIEILKANGIANPEKILKELDEGRKGTKIAIDKLQVIDENNRKKRI